jgi:tRNA A37 threonylcarbamoyladenosine modification protein TsaB
MKKYTLHINTVLDDNKRIEVRLTDKMLTSARISVKAERKQAEKLLPVIEKLLLKAKAGRSEIKKIIVENRGGSFTASRIGIATANALGYALKIPVYGAGEAEGKGIKKIREKSAGYDIVLPEYSGEPNIGKKK